MKRLIFTLLIALTATMAVQAATEYGFYLAGVKVTSSNYSNITSSYLTGGTAVYSPTTNTLTLTNVTINTGTSSNNGITNYDCKGLIVKCVGTCNITTNKSGKVPFRSEKESHLTIAGGTTTLTQLGEDECIYVTKDDGSGTPFYIDGPGKLVLNATKGYGLVCQTIENGTGKLDGPNCTVYYNNSCDVTINTGYNCIKRGAHFFYDGTVTFKATNNSNATDVSVYAMLFYNGSTLTCPDGVVFDSSAGNKEGHNVRVNGEAIYDKDVIVTNKYAVVINSTNFPDNNFRSIMFSYYPKGYLTQEEVNKFTSLYVSNKDISSLKGVELLTSLQSITCSGNPITSLDPGSNTNLNFVNCSGCTSLTSLNVNGCTNLNHLYCYNTAITSLNVSNCSELVAIYCNNTKLTSLNVTGKSKFAYLDCKNCTSLTSLSCYYNALKMLDVTGNTALTYLACYNNSSLTKITGLADCKAITRLHCNECALTDLPGINNMTNLAQLNCYSNQLTSLTVTSKGSLYYVNASLNPLLTTLNCNYNDLITLDVTGNTALTSLTCRFNYNLKAITGLESCTAITKLDCQVCAITDLSACNSMKSLEELSCQHNKLTTLTLNNKPNLTYVNAAGNASMTNALIMSNSNLSTLLISNCTALTSLNCSYNALSSLNLSGNTALKTLDCMRNNLTTLDLKDCTNLQTIYLCQNVIRESGMTSLVNNLPYCKYTSNHFYVLYNKYETNVFNAAHLAAAQAKRWVPQQWDGTAWVNISFSTRGDVDGDSNVTIADVTSLIDYLLSGNATGIDLGAADVDGDNNVTIADVTSLIDYLLSGNWN